MTWGWTERHTAVAILTAVSSTASLAGVLDGGWVAAAVAVGVALCVFVSLVLDTWGGAVVGLGLAAGLVLVRRTFHAWTEVDFGAAAVESVALIVAGAVAGGVSGRLRRGVGMTAGPSAPWEPVYGSLGLLGQVGAAARLEEEVARSVRTDRPLSLLLLDVAVLDPHLSAEGRDAALRAAARLVENRARDHDIPFALGPDRLGIIFPESPSSVAWDVVGRILASVGSANFAFGQDRSPHSLVDAVELYAGLTQHQQGQGWESLLDAAATAVERARSEEEKEVLG